ncbi:MAG: hypothetical protein QM750_08175 [Rubrivivax sp.]
MSASSSTFGRPPRPPAAKPAAPPLSTLVLAWAFNFFGSVRLLTYLPTIWTIHTSGASNQHSLLTWLMWLGANLTMGLMLLQQAPRGSGGSGSRTAAWFSFGNAAMCALTSVAIAIYR